MGVIWQEKPPDSISACGVFNLYDKYTYDVSNPRRCNMVLGCAYLPGRQAGSKMLEVEVTRCLGLPSGSKQISMNRLLVLCDS